MGDEAVAGHKVHHDAACHHKRDEVGQIGDRLGHAFKGVAAHLVEQQRQDDGRRKSHQNLEQADHDGVADGAEGEGTFEKVDEVFQPYPIAAQNALCGPVILEGDHLTCHGEIQEHDVVDHHRNHHPVDPFVLGVVHAQPFPQSRPCLGSAFLFCRGCCNCHIVSSCHSFSLHAFCPQAALSFLWLHGIMAPEQAAICGYWGTNCIFAAFSPP